MNYETLKQWANPIEVDYVNAFIECGEDATAAADVAQVHRSTIVRAIDRLKQRAAVAGYSPEHGMTHMVPDPFVTKRVSTNRDGEGNIINQWTIGVLDAEKRQAALKAAAAAMAETLPKLAPVAAPAITDAKLCNLYTFTDYHMGMMAWHREGGADWNLKIAESLLRKSFVHMVETAPKAATAVINIQGDFLHSDGLPPITPGHGHVLDQDGRFSQIVGAAIRVIRNLIDHALATHQTVHLIIVEGNHDESSACWMQAMFEHIYDYEPRLTVNDSKLPYYAFQFGEVMLAIHHGHKVKNEQLPMLFAAQFAKMWGATTKRYGHAGHRHHADEKEYSGMLITQHPTLSGRDAYAARGGWFAERAAQAITYHTTFGQVGRTIVCPEMFDEAV